MGYWVLALVGTFAAYQFTFTKPYTGLTLVLIGGIGTYLSLIKESQYIRYSKWVLSLGLGLAGLLNTLPKLAISFSGKAQTENTWVGFLGKFTMDEQPLYTILLLVFSFGLAALLAYFDFKAEGNRG